MANEVPVPPKTALGKFWGHRVTAAARGQFLKGATESFGFEYEGFWKAGKHTGFASGLLGKGALLYTGYQLFDRMQREGLMGGVREAANLAVFGGAMRVGMAGFSSLVGGTMASLTSGALGAAGLAVGVGYAGYKIGQGMIDYSKGLRSIELGGGQNVDILNNSAAATMRQRSISALQNTHLNARMAMGNEAVLMHRRAY